MIKFYLQLLIPLALMFYCMPRKKYFWLRLSLSLGVTLLITVLYATPEILFFATDFWKNLIFYLIAYFFGFFVVWISFDLPVIKTAFFVGEAYVVQNLCHHLFEFIMRLANIPAGEEYDTFFRLALLAFIYAIIYFVFFYLMKKLDLRSVINVPSISLGVEFTFLLVMIVFGVFVRHGHNEIFTQKNIALGYEFYSIVLPALILSMFLGLFNIGKLKDNNEELELRIDHESKYYEIARTNADEVGAMCHNLKHQISALKNMTDTQEKEAIISEMEKAVAVYGSIAKTGNSALDSILTEKGIYCYSNDITLSVIADGSLLDNIKFGDIYTLFGNAIDNAIESVMKTEQKELRQIFLKICMRGGMVHIHLENWYDAELTFRDGLPCTTKSGKGHGYGVRSIRYIVEKYGGTLTVETKDHIFALNMMLPMGVEE